MNEDIKDLQDLWQGQESGSVNTQQFIDDLNKVEKKAKLHRRAMLAIFPLTMFVLMNLLPVVESGYYAASIIIIGIAMLMVLFLAYRMKYNHLEDDKGFSNQQFIATHIQKLKNKMTLASKYMWVYGTLLALGINIGYIEVLKELSLNSRIGIHVLATVLIMALMYFTIKHKMATYEKEIVPLIDKLNKMKR